MSLLTDLLGKAVSHVAGQKDGPLQKLLGVLLAKVTLSSLVEKFQKAGLDKVIASWISQGKNLPITPDQVSHLLGDDQIQAMAKEYELPPDEVKRLLAQHLPELVDQLTPDGKVPEGH